MEDRSSALPTTPVTWQEEKKCEICTRLIYVLNLHSHQGRRKTGFWKNAPSYKLALLLDVDKTGLGTCNNAAGHDHSSTNVYKQHVKSQPVETCAADAHVHMCMLRYMRTYTLKKQAVTLQADTDTQTHWLYKYRKKRCLKKKKKILSYLVGWYKVVNLYYIMPPGGNFKCVSTFGIDIELKQTHVQ